jgi:Protein of unknown function (DUF3489)
MGFAIPAGMHLIPPGMLRSGAVPKRKAKPAPGYAERFAAILKLLRNPRGATVSEIAKARGLQPHTVLSVLSRLGSKAGLVLTRTKVEGRGGLGIASGEKQVLRSRAELSFSCPSLRARV